ncbi:MAG: hypothetical protein COA33_012450 [Fluviicola sp.]|nr:hypothetical protein [Fluviicola sp.]
MSIFLIFKDELTNLKTNTVFRFFLGNRVLYYLVRFFLNLPPRDTVVIVETNNSFYKTYEKKINEELNKIGQLFMANNKIISKLHINEYSLSSKVESIAKIENSWLQINCNLHIETGGGIIYGYNYVKLRENEFAFWSNIESPELELKRLIDIMD